jgi:hypothetical protein
VNISEVPLLVIFEIGNLAVGTRNIEKDLRLTRTIEHSETRMNARKSLPRTQLVSLQELHMLLDFSVLKEVKWKLSFLSGEMNSGNIMAIT